MNFTGSTNFLKVSPGQKDDREKTRLDLIEPQFIEAVGEILTFGADKYEANSWQKVENAKDRYYAALMRHLMAWRGGEEIDPESGLTHLAHVACNVMFLMHFERNK